MAVKEYRKLSTLKNWDKNPRSIKDKDYQRLKKQLTELGEFKPLLITEDGIVYGGNMRLRAMGELGWDEAWVSVIEADTEEDKLKYALADNDRAGYYDEDLLANLTGEFPEFEWGDFAVDLKPPITLDDLFPDEVIEDEVPEVVEGEANSKMGEVYELGRHRLMCGDATKREDVDKLMDGKKANMVFTSPPYNTGNADADANYYKKKRKTFYKNKDVDNMSKEEYYIFSTTILKNLSNIVSDKHVVLWNTSYNSNSRDNYGKIIFGLDNPFKVKETIIWDKQSAINIAASGILGRICEFIFLLSKNEDYLTNQLKTDCWFNVWRINAHGSQTKEISACFPIKLPIEAINRFTKDYNIVVDPFGGSGSTLIACEQTNRICYMMEIDPKYCDVIRKRYQNYVDKQ